MSEPGVEVISISDHDIAILRGMVGEGFTDQQLAEALALTMVDDGLPNLNLAAADLWGRKAAQTADLVTVRESGSERMLSDLHKNALAMQKHFHTLGTAASPLAPGAPDPAARRSRTRAIVRD